MKFINKESVYTKRLTLRQIEQADFDNLIDIFLNEEVKKTYMIPDFKSREDALKLAERFSELSKNYDRFVYGVCLNNRLIGFVNDVFIGENTVELGYAIHPNFKNNGYATEVLTACIKLIFESGFEVLKTGAFEENLASLRVMQKCGMEEILELRTAQEKLLGDDFDAREFHKQLLDIGPAPFPIVKKYTNNNLD